MAKQAEKHKVYQGATESTPKKKKIDQREDENEEDFKFLHAGESWDSELENFLFTEIIIQRGPHFFYAISKDRLLEAKEKYDPTKLEIHPIQRSHVFPILPVRAPDPLPPNAFLKQPYLVGYSENKSSTGISDMIMREAQMCELIKRSPHHNIAEYFGCCIDGDGRIFELCFAKYGKTLDQMVKDGDVFDRKACLNDIRAGIEHLHSIGIIHCCITPRHVFAGEGYFVIGDFDSCALEGNEVGPAFETPFSTDNDFKLAQRENDWLGFAEIEKFLASPKNKN